MQTFITSSAPESVTPYEICRATAFSLDSARLGKQRVECKQIYSALTTGEGWIHHPATKMWAGHHQALAAYAFWICEGWTQRGFEDSLAPYFLERMGGSATDWPWWFGNPEMVACHRSSLLRKAPEHYSRLFSRDARGRVSVPTLYKLPYLWPDPDVPGVFRLSGAEHKRDDYELPSNWHVNPSNREVTFT